MRSSLIEARPAPGGQGYAARPAPRFQHLPPPPASPQKRRRLPLVPAEGWLPLFLLAVAVYSVVYAVTAALAINHSDILWITTALGLLCGLLISKSRLFPQAILHIAACILGYWLALALTGALAYHVSLLEMLASLHAVIANNFTLTGTQDSEMVFLFYLAFLCFFLGYFGSWLIYRAHLPWLVALVYVSIMIVNLNALGQHDLSWLVILLVTALILLIARVNLAGQLAQWKSEGLTTSQSWLRGLTGRSLRLAGLFALLVLPLSWLLPVPAQPASGVTLWNNLDNAWANLSHGNFSSLTNPSNLFSPYQPAANFFGDQLTISGNVNLPNGPVLSYASTTPTTGQYLAGYSLDIFDGHTWTSQIQNTSRSYMANTQLPLEGSTSPDSSTLTTSLTLLQPPGGSKHFLFAPAQPGKFTVPVTIYTDPAGNFITAWTQTAPLQANEQYRVVSRISTATPAQLARVPLPTDDPAAWQNSTGYNQLRQYYLQVPQNLSPEVLATAQTWTRGLSTTYAVATALQNQLSNPASFTYAINNPPVPANIDAVTWLLHTHQGYCTYYATAMVMMARLLHIPARIVNGFSQGHYNAQQKIWQVNGSDAHSWVQVYFPGYGWINFDPTPGFSMNSAGSPTLSPTRSTTIPPATSSPTTTVQKQPTPETPPTSTPLPTGSGTLPPSTPTTSPGENLFLLLSLLILGGSCVVLGFAIVHYRRGRRGPRTLITSIYARLCRIASVAGSPPAAWQTPYEYMFTLGKRFPQASAALRRLGDLFVRERWATSHHAPTPAEQHEIAQLWPTLRNTILRSRFSKNR